VQDVLTRWRALEQRKGSGRVHQQQGDSQAVSHAKVVQRCRMLDSHLRLFVFFFLILTPVAGPIFETKNREIFLERFFWRDFSGEK